MINRDYAREVLLLGLKNAHAMESQALSIMRPQMKRLDHYPELTDQLQLHISETEGQIERLDSILDRMGESHSSVKDTVLAAFGTMSALGHTAAGDEVLKNTFANLAFENFEIAAYTSLITAARAMGDAESIPLLEQSLEEEKRMASWVAESVPGVTERFIALKSSGETAKR
jgi:ferritin-like metal-binding protein YciE